MCTFKEKKKEKKTQNKKKNEEQLGLLEKLPGTIVVILLPAHDSLLSPRWLTPSQI